jgi:hypothetical protein
MDGSFFFFIFIFIFHLFIIIEKKKIRGLHFGERNKKKEINWKKIHSKIANSFGLYI